MNIKAMIEEVATTYFKSIKAGSIDKPSDCMILDFDRKTFIDAFNAEIKAALYMNHLKNIKSKTEFGMSIAKVDYFFDFNDIKYEINCFITFTKFNEGKYKIYFYTKNLTTEDKKTNTFILTNNETFESFAKNKFVLTVLNNVAELFPVTGLRG